MQLNAQSGVYVAQAFSDDELFGGTGDFSSDDELFGGSSSFSSDDDLFGDSSSFSSDDDLFGGAPSLYNDDELFGGTSNFSSDDDLFGGSSNFTSDDDLFGGSSSFSSDDDLFGGADDFSSDDAFFDDMISDVDITSTQNDVSAADAIFDAGTIRAGGAFATTSTLSAVWYNPFKPNTVKRDYIKDGFEHTAFQPTFDSYIYLDARPTTNFRVYTKLKFDFPPPPLYPFLSYDEHPKWQMCECNVKLFELFADFSLLDRAFFRFGKHTVTWGVGYFFSPADVINLSAIDIANPTEQREGAVSLRTQVIFPGTQNCLWLYLLPDKDSDKDDDEYDAELKYTALAAKYEFLLKNYELGLGAWYQYGRTPRLVATVTGPLKNAAVFAEGVLGYGTEAQWAPLGKTAKKNAEKAHTSAPAIQYRDMKPVFQGTVGASYTWSRQKVTLIGQYFYNGFGSKEAKKLSPAAFLDLQNTYNYSGRHYLAASLSKSELFTRDLSASLFALVSLDGFYDFFSRKYEDAPLPASLDFKGFSGMVQGTLNYTFADKFTLSTGPVLTFGKEGTEFTRVGGYPAKSTLVWRLSLKLDAGKY